MFERVGFVGLGIMGKLMARNLISAGYNLVVQTRSPKKAEELVKEGAEAAGSSREVAEKSSVIITTDARPPNVLQPYCDRASTRWYTMDKQQRLTTQNPLNKRDSRTH